jgi:mRNA-degrading endonuclease RelE of RelBE toxin-antitoxin system
MNFSATPGFEKDLKWLAKKFRSLTQDLAEFKRVAAAIPLGTSKHFANLHRGPDVSIVKARLFCRTLKGSSLRIVYAYEEKRKRIELIELYFKGEQERESRERMEEWMKKGVTGAL